MCIMMMMMMKTFAEWRDFYDVAAYQKICYAEFWLRMD
jgi:hypothetical protein